MLDAKRCFASLDLCQDGAELLAPLRGNAYGLRAIGIAFQEIRKAGLSNRIADLSVCGAIALYNVLCWAANWWLWRWRRRKSA